MSAVRCYISLQLQAAWAQVATRPLSRKRFSPGRAKSAKKTFPVIYDMETGGGKIPEIFREGCKKKNSKLVMELTANQRRRDRQEGRHHEEGKKDIAGVDRILLTGE